MENLLNKRGFTLIETIAGLLIISIILLSFFSFFGQTLLFSSKAEESYSSTNLVDKLVHEVKENEAIQEYLEKNGTNACDDVSSLTLPRDKDLFADDVGFEMEQLDLLWDAESGNYYYPLNNKKYVAEVKICQNLDESELSLFRVQASLKESDDGGSSDMIHYLNLK